MVAYGPQARMTSSSINVARASAAARRIAPWLAGPAVLIVRHDAVELAAPSACPGLLELLSIAAARISPTTPIGDTFGMLRTVVVVVSIAAVAELVRRLTRSV